MTKILIIDDERLLLEEVSNWLRFEGYEVLAAADGESGLAYAIDERPDLILCDIAMPGLDGHGVLLEVRSSRDLRHIPFIFLTARADHGSVRKGMNLGADDYITKPFKQKELMDAISARLKVTGHRQADLLEQIDVLNQALDAEASQRLMQSQIMGMLSHDFRNSLTSILSSTELVDKYADRLEPERRALHFSRIRGGVHLLMQMLDDLLASVELEHGYFEYQPQPVEIAGFLQALTDEFRLMYGESHQFDLNVPRSALITSDPDLLRHIISNLLSNAVKYSPRGSRIAVDLCYKEQGVEIAVQDEGIGIPAEELPHLFEPFFRAEGAREQKGTGLGLAIVQEAVTQCGGSIEVESEPGVGTRFSVTLPVELSKAECS